MVNHDFSPTTIWGIYVFFSKHGTSKAKVFKLKPLFLKGGGRWPGKRPSLTQSFCCDPGGPRCISLRLCQLVAFHLSGPELFLGEVSQHEVIKVERWNVKSHIFGTVQLKAVYISNFRCNYSELCRFKKPDHWHEFEFFLGVSRFFWCSGDVRWCHVNSPPKRPRNSRIPTDPAVESSTVGA